MDPHAVVVIALVCSGAALLFCYAATHAYFRGRQSNDLERATEQQRVAQRGYMSEVRDRNKETIAVKNGYLPQALQPVKQPLARMDSTESR